MADCLTLRKSAQFFFSGKKPDPEIPGKILELNFTYLGSDFQNRQQKLLIYE